MEGIVELTPLASAASKGLTAMVRLLMENGANVNYLCSVGVLHVYTSILMNVQGRKTILLYSF